MNARRAVLTLALLGLSAPAGAAASPDAATLRTMAMQQAAESWPLLREALSLPNDAHFPDQVEANVDWATHAFESRGFGVERLETGGSPLLLAQRPGPASTARTLLVYLHLDGQPVDASQWSQPDPYVPVLKQRDGDGWREIPWARLGRTGDPEWRVFARSAADDKGPVVMLLTALDALAANGEAPRAHLKVVMDLEEERGSPHLPAAVNAHADALAADALLILDGPRHASGRPTLVFGARGIAEATLTVFGPRTPQHSGHYGNWVPNPAVRLAQLIASMKDAEGRVTIPGFYDGVSLDAETRALLARTPDDEVAIRRQLGIAASDAVGGSLQEALQYPSLNVRGLAAGWVGPQARTIIPASATAEIDVRLVPESDPERLMGLIRSHVESQGFHLVAGDQPTDQERARYPRLASFRYSVSYGAFRTPYDSDLGRRLTRALTRAFGDEPVRVRMSGGSVPIAPFVARLGVPAVVVGTVNKDDNQHGPDENLRIGNYVEGVQTLLAILTEE